MRGCKIVPALGLGAFDEHLNRGLLYCSIKLKNLYATGGPQLCTEYKPPLYERVQVPHSFFKQQLGTWQTKLQEQLPGSQPHLTVDVAIPSYRANPEQLEKLLNCTVTEPNVSLRVLLQIDHPTPSAAAAKYIINKQNEMMHQLRVRHNECNCGAGMTRNALLDASAAQYIIFFDDDVEPSRDCINAYIRAARQQPEAPGFAGQSICNHPMTMQADCSGQCHERSCAYAAVTDDAVARQCMSFLETFNQSWLNMVALKHFAVEAHDKQNVWQACAGPTCLPHGPGLVAAAVQLSDVGFFWEVPSKPFFPKVPWAVTANLMIKNTDIRPVTFVAFVVMSMADSQLQALFVKKNLLLLSVVQGLQCSSSYSCSLTLCMMTGMSTRRHANDTLAANAAQDADHATQVFGLLSLHWWRRRCGLLLAPAWSPDQRSCRCCSSPTLAQIPGNTTTRVLFPIYTFSVVLYSESSTGTVPRLDQQCCLCALL